MVAETWFWSGPQVRWSNLNGNLFVELVNFSHACVCGAWSIWYLFPVKVNWLSVFGLEQSKCWRWDSSTTSSTLDANWNLLVWDSRVGCFLKGGIEEPGNLWNFSSFKCALVLVGTTFGWERRNFFVSRKLLIAGISSKSNHIKWI